MNKRRVTHDKLKKELLKNPKTRAAYDALEDEYQLLSEMLRARRNAHMTQVKMAKAMKTTPSVISRLESIQKNKPSPTFNTLKKYAHVLNCHLSIKLIPKKVAK